MAFLSRYKNRVCFVFIFSCLFFYNPPYAHATGGAYTSTKHGGGTTDGVTPCAGGVNRGVQGTDYDAGGVGNCTNTTTPTKSYYGTWATSEAGVYSSGECAHCHEPHASFGGAGIEPPPNAASSAGDAGPDPYLVMKDYSTTVAGTYSTLCWYCHENMTLNSQTKGYGYWGFYQGGTKYTGSSHYNSINFYWPGATGGPGVGGTPDTTATWPRRARGTAACTASTGNCGSCLNCHTPHGVSGTFDTNATGPTASDYIVATTQTGLIPRQLIAREEALCLNCHDGSPANAGGTITAGTGDVKTQVDKYTLSADGSGHPVRSSTYYGVHTLSETPANGWLKGKAHAECTDCHNPHVAQGYGSSSATYPSPQRATRFQWSGTTSFQPNRDTSGSDYDATTKAVYIGPVNYGVWGITVTQSTGAYASTVNLGSTNYLYDLCFKCHSYWAWGDGQGTNTNQTVAPSVTKTFTGAGMPPSTLKMTDVAYEFVRDTTINLAWHPVYGAGRNQPAANANAAWGNCTSTANWSNCGCQTAGGIALPGTGTGTSGQPCPGVITGNTRDLSQNFVPPWTAASVITCVDCHEYNNIDGTGAIARGPHGSSAPFILRKLQGSAASPITYSVANGAGGTITMNYSAMSYWTKESTAASSTSNLYGTAANSDPNNFCLNCHRADVYGFKSVVCASTVGGPYFYTFPRQTHPVDYSSGARRSLCDSSGAVTAGAPPRGIVCMRCHGGGIAATGTVNGRYAKLGNIHGTRVDTSNVASNSIGRALIGGIWYGYVPGTTTSVLTCSLTTDNTYVACSDSGNNQGSGTNANYNYTPP